MKWKTVLKTCAAIFLIAALSLTAFAATSATDQMAANSAAWWVAHNAGDTATCEALHAENERLAKEVAGSGGTATFSSSGSWTITDAAGNTTKSSSSKSGKNNNITYTTTSATGRVSSTTAKSYSDSSISAYKNAGGTNEGLINSYNNAAFDVSSTNGYAGGGGSMSAASEVAVVKEVLGLSDAEAAQLQAELEMSKQAYYSAHAAYEDALAAGDTAAAAAAKEQMDAAHEAAQNTRSEYNYSGDDSDYENGGFYKPSATTQTLNKIGSFLNVDLRQSFTINASCNDGGTISPSGRVRVKSGDAKAFTFSPKSGYAVKSVLVDNVEKGSCNSYYFSSVTGDHTLKVTFARASATITATAGTGGTISPSGKTSIVSGGSQKYTVRAESGYEIEDVLVDGVSQGPISSYTFSNITGDHTITAKFRAVSDLGIGAIELTDTLGASLNGKSMKSGYGFMVRVPVSAEGLTDIQVKLRYNFGSGEKTVTLQKSGGVYVFPVNAESPTDCRCVYVPAAAQDADYTLTVDVTGKNAAGAQVSDTARAVLTIRGVMYEDDFTGDS